MSLSGLNHLPIEYISFDNSIPLAVLILGICIQVSLHIIFDWENKIYSFFLGSDRACLHEEETGGQLKSKSPAPIQRSRHEKKSQDSAVESTVCKGDVEVVFRSLGMLSHPPQGREGVASFDFEERLDPNVVSDMFEEKEPSEDEIRAAFDVFDENKDGFIDAKELQKLLCALGLRQGSELENCRRMIRAADENGDDRIDFNEFVHFMQTIFC